MNYFLKKEGISEFLDLKKKFTNPDLLVRAIKYTGNSSWPHTKWPVVFHTKISMVLAIKKSKASMPKFPPNKWIRNVDLLPKQWLEALYFLSPTFLSSLSHCYKISNCVQKFNFHKNKTKNRIFFLNFWGKVSFSRIWILAPKIVIFECVELLEFEF